MINVSIIFKSLAQTVRTCKYVYKYVDRQKGFGCHTGVKRSAGVSREVNLMNPWFLNPGQTSTEVKKRGTSSPTKSTDVLQIIFQKYCFYFGKKSDGLIYMDTNKTFTCVSNRLHTHN